MMWQIRSPSAAARSAAASLARSGIRPRHAVRRPRAPILLTLLAALAGDAAAREGGPRETGPENECRRSPALSDGSALAFGRIGAPGRTAFVKDGLARKGCPDPGEACRERAYLVTGDPILLGERRGGFVCASFRGAVEGMGRTGWLPAEAVAVEPPAPVARDVWLGTWIRAEAEIRVSPGKAAGTLAVSGSATWGGGDPDRVARGGIHTGEMEGTVTPAGDSASFGMGEDGSLPIEKADPADCKVWLRRMGPWLVVDDNLACGGMNVTFRGLYRRGPRSRAVRRAPLPPRPLAPAPPCPRGVAPVRRPGRRFVGRAGPGLAMMKAPR